MATATMAAHSGTHFAPREHGATAMMLTPFFSAAILQRQWYWQELVTFVAILAALAIKDPLVVIARQYWVWKQDHPETTAARRAAGIEILVLATCAIPLVLTRDWHRFALLFLGAAAFTGLALAVNVRNRQRSVWFQVVSAVALSGTSIAACLSGSGSIPAWCWALWVLSAIQAAAGIFVVHARLDARIGAKTGRSDHASRRAAFLLQFLLLVGCAVCGASGHYWLVAALAITSLGYLLDLRRQKSPESLQMPLTRVGLQALALSIGYAVLVIVGLW